jgi:hypothetical protein
MPKREAGSEPWEKMTGTSIGHFHRQLKVKFSIPILDIDLVRCSY